MKKMPSAVSRAASKKIRRWNLTICSHVEMALAGGNNQKSDLVLHDVTATHAPLVLMD